MRKLNYLYARRIVEIIDRSCLRREADSHLVYLALVGCVRQGIALFVYLPQGNLGSGIELELEDIDIVGTLEYAVDTPLACLLLDVGVIFAEQQHDEIEGVLEMALALHRVILALETIGDV